MEGLAGDSVQLPCEVDEANCGTVHNIKWYKSSDRVYVFSERDQYRSANGSLLSR